MHTLLAVLLSALPCGLTDAFLGEPCAPEDEPVDAGVPSGLLCFELRSGGTGRDAIWVRETTWLDPTSCQLGRVVESGGGGSPFSVIGRPEALPRGVKLAPLVQASLTAHVVPPRESASNPAHGLSGAFARLPRASGGKTTVMPRLAWWRGPVPPPTDSAQPTRTRPELGVCPCQERFSASRFTQVREWRVGAQTLSVWGNGARNQHFAVAVTDARDARHRWIHRGYVSTSTEPFEAHLEGTRWYLPVSHFVEEQLLVLGYDAKTGEAWQVSLPGAQLLEVSDAGLGLQLEDGPVQRPWATLGPGR